MLVTKSVFQGVHIQRLVTLLENYNLILIRVTIDLLSNFKTLIENKPDLACWILTGYGKWG
jgi:hypothetical protein